MQPTDQWLHRHGDTVGRIKSKAIIIAAHTDFAPNVAKRRAAGESEVFRRYHMPKLTRGGYTAVCDHVAGDTKYLVDFPFKNSQAGNRLKFGMQGIASVKRDIGESTDVRVITSTDEIRTCKVNGDMGLVLCFEGGGPIEDDVGLLDVYAELGLRCFGLTHDFRNLLADGVRVRSGGGLTEIGVKAVSRCEQLGIVVDVSHLNDAGFWDVVRTATRPFIASHSNARALCPNPRNLADDMLRAIAEADGVVGFHALGSLITLDDRIPTIYDLMAHIAHLCEVMGPSHVAIGPDIMEDYPKTEYDLLWQDERLPRMEFRYAAEYSSVADTTTIIAAMLELGLTEDEITGILGGNLLRVFDQIWAPIEA